ncbi:MAG: bidirectional hydrogenase complex protein HoxE [Blastocatellia bacterium]|nr:bidirectional hydrogenase complex protein HoxE [Blastocatellia bacterium]
MAVIYARPPLPSEDVRWRIVQGTMRRQGYSSNALIETLHAVQKAFGYIDPVAMKFVARSLRLPLSKVYGVVTFYHLFSLRPQGRHTCVICTGTACYIKGTPALLASLKREYGAGDGETTADGAMSVLTARCLGACGLAPAGIFDGEIAGNLTVEETLDRVRAWEAK